MKMKNIQAYDVKDVPDYLIEECASLGSEICALIINHCCGKPQNIVFGAITMAHASLIDYMVTEDCLEKAAKLAAIGLLKNVEALAKIKKVDEN